MKLSYVKSIHEKVAVQVFDTCAVEDSGEKIPCLFLGFVNRSGSNYLAELLRSTGAIVGLEESLNDYTLRVLSEKFGTRDFAQYLRRLHAEQTTHRAQLWGLKVGWMQLAMLMRFGAVPHLLTPRMLIIRRKDVIGQAVSLFIAERTAQWTTEEAPRAPREKVEYDGQKILNTLRGIMQSYASLQQMAIIGGIPFSELFYEDLLDSPAGLVTRATESLFGRALGPRPEAVRISIQRDDLDDRFRRRFLEDLAEIEWESTS